MNIKTVNANLIGGVSQQPVGIRRPDQCAEMVNFWPSPVDGLVRRMPTEHIEILDTSTPDVAKFHSIYRDNAERYVVIFEDTQIRVFDLTDGTSVPVVMGATAAYMNSMTTSDDIRVITVGDYTFVANRNEVVAKSSATTSATPTGASDDAFVFVRAGNYKTKYEVEFSFDGTPYGPFTTDTWDGNTATGGEISDIQTQAIAADLVTKIGSITDLTVTQEGSVIRLAGGNSKAIDWITTTDSVGDSTLAVFHNTTERVEGFLPEICYNGFKIKVVGAAEVDGDDYWVEFVSDGGASKPFAKGFWRETNAPGEEYQWDASTLPHQLVRTFNGAGGSVQFEWDEVTWGDRTVGDVASVPWPSIIDRKISDLFFYKGRLGFLADDRIVMSETREYFNLFRTTMLTLRDTAPIDYTVRHSRAADLRHATPFDESVIIFSDRTQFLLKGGDILSPRTVQVIPAAEYESDTLAEPVATARSVLYPFRRGEQSGLGELFRIGDSETFQSVDASHEVPNYIQGRIDLLVGSTLENTVVVVTDEEPNTVYLYKYLWGGNEKVQSSWGKWSFGKFDAIRHVAFVENDIYFLIDRAGGDDLMLEKMTLATGLSDGSNEFIVHIDRRLTQADVVSAVYDDQENETTITLPYVVDHWSPVLCAGSDGLEHEVLSGGGTTAVVRGDLSAANFWIGISYYSYVTLTPPIAKVQAGRGFVGEYHTRQKVRKGYLQYSQSRYFDVKVKVGNRREFTYTFNGMEVGTAENTVDSIILKDGEFPFPVRGEAKDLTITIENSSPYPSNLALTRWLINYMYRGTPFQG